MFFKKEYRNTGFYVTKDMFVPGLTIIMEKHEPDNHFRCQSKMLQKTIFRDLKDNYKDQESIRVDKVLMVPEKIVDYSFKGEFGEALYFIDKEARWMRYLTMPSGEIINSKDIIKIDRISTGKDVPVKWYIHERV